MLLSATYVRSLGAGLFLVAVFQAGCAVPLGPGFGHSARQITVGTVPAAPSLPTQVHLRVTDRLVNAGNRDLAFIDVDLPLASTADQGHLTFHVDDRELQATATGAGGSWRIRFDSPWAPGQRRTVVMDYDLNPEFSEHGLVAAASNGFYVADRSAIPAWLAPTGAFAKVDSRARAETMEVTVPAEYRVLASGLQRRKRRSGTMAVHQFQRGLSGPPPYLIAGRFQEQRLGTSQGKVVFWTFQPLDAGQAQIAAKRLAATAATYRKLFGPVSTRPWRVHIVETEAPALPADATENGIGAASFPEGVLLDQGSMSQGIASEPVLERLEAELARIWFGWYAQPSSEAQILLGRGISLYAVTRAAAARGGESARNDQITQLLVDYDAQRLRGQDGALLKIPADATREQQTTDAYRGALFFVTLEDLAGRENFDSALRRMLQAMAGGQIDADDLRSALEASTGRDLAEVFRTWLNKPSIPDDFRARYVAGRNHR